MIVYLNKTQSEGKLKTLLCLKPPPRSSHFLILPLEIFPVCPSFYSPPLFRPTSLCISTQFFQVLRWWWIKNIPSLLTLWLSPSTFPRLFFLPQLSLSLSSILSLSLSLTRVSEVRINSTILRATNLLVSHCPQIFICPKMKQIPKSSHVTTPFILFLYLFVSNFRLSQGLGEF